MIETATCYQGRDNFFSLILKKNGIVLTPEEMDAITKFEIRYQGAYYDSVTTTTGFVKDSSTASIKINPRPLGLIASNDLVELIVYDAGDYINGVVWGIFRLWIKPDAIPV